MEQNNRYVSSSWAMLRRDKGWIKPVLVLACASFVPIVGWLGLTGYALEWARLTAWGVDSAPKQRGVNVGGCIKSGWRGFVVSLCFGLVAGVISSFFMFLLGGSVLAVPITWCLTIASVLLSLVASLRATIYQRIGAGFQIDRIWEMIRADWKGLLKIGGVYLLIYLALGFALSIVSFVALIPLVMRLAVGLQGYDMYDLQYLDNESARYVVSQVFASLSYALPLIVIVIFLSTIVSVVMTLIGQNSIGLWMRQFNVSSWGASEDPIPTGTGLPPAGAGYAPYGQPTENPYQQQYPQDGQPYGQPYPGAQQPYQDPQAAQAYPSQDVYGGQAQPAQPYGQAPADAMAQGYGQPYQAAPTQQVSYGQPTDVMPAPDPTQAYAAPATQQFDPYGVPTQQVPVVPLPMMEVPQYPGAVTPSPVNEGASYGAADAQDLSAAAQTAQGEDIVEVIDLTRAQPLDSDVLNEDGTDQDAAPVEDAVSADEEVAAEAVAPVDEAVAFADAAPAEFVPAFEQVNAVAEQVPAEESAPLAPSFETLSSDLDAVEGAAPAEPAPFEVAQEQVVDTQVDIDQLGDDVTVDSSYVSTEPVLEDEPAEAASSDADAPEDAE